MLERQDNCYFLSPLVFQKKVSGLRLWVPSFWQAGQTQGDGVNIYMGVCGVYLSWMTCPSVSVLLFFLFIFSFFFLIFIPPNLQCETITTTLGHHNANLVVIPTQWGIRHVNKKNGMVVLRIYEQPLAYPVLPSIFFEPSRSDAQFFVQWRALCKSCPPCRTCKVLNFCWQKNDLQVIHIHSRLLDRCWVLYLLSCPHHFVHETRKCILIVKVVHVIVLHLWTAPLQDNSEAVIHFLSGMSAQKWSFSGGLPKNGHFQEVCPKMVIFRRSAQKWLKMVIFRRSAQKWSFSGGLLLKMIDFNMWACPQKWSFSGFGFLLSGFGFLLSGFGLLLLDYPHRLEFANVVDAL